MAHGSRTGRRLRNLRRRNPKRGTRSTNWLLIGGLTAAALWWLSKSKAASATTTPEAAVAAATAAATAAVQAGAALPPVPDDAVIDLDGYGAYVWAPRR